MPSRKITKSTLPTITPKPDNNALIASILFFFLSFTAYILYHIITNLSILFLKINKWNLDVIRLNRSKKVMGNYPHHIILLSSLMSGKLVSHHFVNSCVASSHNLFASSEIWTISARHSFKFSI